MNALVIWAGFLGAWLLVGGPIYQAVLELDEEEVDRERMESMRAAETDPDPVSPWWWLVPPVKLLLENRHKNRLNRSFVDRLSDEDLRAVTSYIAKARGWMIVATGGLLIAVKETWELVEHEGWADAVFWLLLVVMLMLALGNAVGMSRRYQRARERRT